MSESRLLIPIILGLVGVLIALVPFRAILRRRKVEFPSPRTPRVFHHKKLLFYLGLVLIPVVLLALLGAIMDYRDNGEDFAGVIVASVLLLLPLAMVGYGLLRRFGVDEEKVWSAFFPFFYREVRFDELTYIHLDTNQIKVYSGSQKLNIDFNRFDYSLALLRILEETKKRPITMGAYFKRHVPDDEGRRIIKQAIAELIVRERREYFSTHASDLLHLQNLVATPDR